MKPKFKNRLAWEQAQILMQPALIRIIDNVRKQLDECDWQGSYKEISEPMPGYHLCLTRNDRAIEVDIWELCYQVCFTNYDLKSTHLLSDDISYEVEIDTRLLDETGEVDWHLLEAKAQQSVKQVFEDLPA